MSDLDKYYTALRNADAAGDVEAAKQIAAHINTLRSGSVEQAKTIKIDPKKIDESGVNLADLAGGLVRGAGSIGATVLTPIDWLARKAGIENDYIGRADRRAAMDAALKELGADPTSLTYKAGKIGTEIAGTLPIGGLLGSGLVKGAAAISPSVARAVTPLAQSISSGGFNVPSAAANPVVNMLTRMAGGGINAAASAGAVDPETAKTAGLMGAALPPSAKAAMGMGRYAGNLASSLYRPFTEKGQEILTGQMLKNALGDSAVNAAEIVPGSLPTLAEATGNANIAGLQRTIRDTLPNGVERFVQREANNAAARNAYFDKAAGDLQKLDAAIAARSNATSPLYDAAKKEGFSKISPELKSQIESIMQTPAMQEAVKRAETTMANLQIPKTDVGSVQGLMYANQNLGDIVGNAIATGNKSYARSVTNVKNNLNDIIEQVSPKYAQANKEFAQMSAPVNQMEFLQGLRLTDARGNITLSKVKNALDNIQRQSREPGVNAAKSLAPEQIQILQAIRDDLLRAGNQSAGKAIGSNTLQNIATNNFLSQALPGRIGELAVGKVGTPLAQLGKLAYSGSNEAMRQKLAEAMLNPQYAQELIKAAALADASKYGGLLGTVGKTLLPVAPRVPVFGGLLSQSLNAE